MTASATVDIAALKSRHPLGDTVEAAGVELSGRGRVRQGVCPFHAEAEGSFTVYGDTERWWCFGCGAGGDVLDFVQRVEGVGLPEAIRRLEAEGGCTVRSGEAVDRRPVAAPGFARDPAALTAAMRFYAGRLRRSPEAGEYLAARGIGAGAAARLGLGYAPGSGLRTHLESAGFGAERLSRSGLFTPRGERFAGMIVVPDAAGSITRWMAARAIDPGASPRFQAPPGTKPVLGLSRLGAAPPWLVLTEGLFDWVALAGWGLPACSALGTQGAERIAASLRGCGRVFLAFDADDAGREMTGQLTALLGRRAAPVTLPGGISDAAEIAALPGGRAAFMRLLKAAARNAR